VRIDVFGKNNTRMSIEFKFVAEYVKLSGIRKTSRKKSGQVRVNQIRSGQVRLQRSGV
jgi:hypothetical protein